MLKQRLLGDIVVRSSSDVLYKADVLMKPDLKYEIAAIPGVKQVLPDREADYNYHGETIRIQTVVDQIEKMRLVEGDNKVVREKVNSGDGIIISQAFEDRQNVHLSDKIKFNTPMGTKEFEVVGIYVDTTSLKGAVGLTYNQYSQIFNDNGVDFFVVNLEKGTNAEKIKQEIIQRLGQKQPIIAQTNAEYSKELYKIVDDAIGLVKLLEIMVMFVSFLGVVNTMFISILQRTREIGILRAIGAMQKDIRKMILVESGLIGLFGAVLGAVIGSLFSYITVKQQISLTGYHFLYSHPWSLIVNMFLVTMFISLVAGYYPAAMAARVNVVTAIEYE